MRPARRTEIALLVLLAPGAMLVVASLIIFRAYWIPSGSMKPNLLIGDYLLVNRAAYGFPALMCNMGQCTDDMGPFGGLPARGDVVTFVHPRGSFHYIKRVVGLPGDTVQIVDGQLLLNGQPVGRKPDGTFEEPYVLGNGYLACKNAPVSVGETCLKDRAQEVLPDGRHYLIINIADDLKSDNTAIFQVPAGHVFVMGDNRDNSLDSRISTDQGGIGFVPLPNMVGRADVILFSLTGQPGRVLRWVE